MNKEEINSVLEPQEQIVWQGVMSRRLLVVGLIISLIVSLIIIFWLTSWLFAKDIIQYTSNGIPAEIAGSSVGKVVLGVGVLLIIQIIIGFFRNLVIVYTITKKRVLIRSGIIGTDFNSIYFTQIRNANVNVGLVDKIFGVGTINIDTGKIETVQGGSGDHPIPITRTAYDKLTHITNPYEVYKFFQTTLTGREESLYSGRADRENMSKNNQV